MNPDRLSYFPSMFLEQERETSPGLLCSAVHLYMVVDTRTLFCSDKHSYENNSSNQCTLLKRNIACVALKNLLVSSTPHLLHLQSNNKEGKLIIMNQSASNAVLVLQENLWLFLEYSILPLMSILQSEIHRLGKDPRGHIVQHTILQSRQFCDTLRATTCQGNRTVKTAQ